MTGLTIKHKRWGRSHLFNVWAWRWFVASLSVHLFPPLRKWHLGASFGPDHEEEVGMLATLHLSPLIWLELRVERLDYPEGGAA